MGFVICLYKGGTNIKYSTLLCLGYLIFRDTNNEFTLITLENWAGLLKTFKQLIQCLFFNL